MRVALRHLTQAHGSKETVIIAAKVKIDLTRHVVTREEVEVKLTATEFKLLAHLASNSGRVLTHRSILDSCLGRTRSR